MSGKHELRPTESDGPGRRLDYMKRTEETGDLPLYDPPTYEQTLEAGSFGCVTGD